MSVLLDQVASANANNTSSNQINVSITPGAGATLGIVIHPYNSASGARVSQSASWDGVGMTAITNLDLNQGSMGLRFYLRNGIPTGSAVTVTTITNVATHRAVIALTVSGFDPSAPSAIVAAALNTIIHRQVGNGNAPSVNLPDAQQGGLVIGAVIQGSNNNISAGADQTDRASAGFGAAANWMASTEPGLPNVAHSYSWSAAQDFSMGALVVNPVNLIFLMDQMWSHAHSRFRM